jgi:hypothetical protein
MIHSIHMRIKTIAKIASIKTKKALRSRPSIMKKALRSRPSIISYKQSSRHPKSTDKSDQTHKLLYVPNLSGEATLSEPHAGLPETKKERVAGKPPLPRPEATLGFLRFYSRRRCSTTITRLAPPPSDKLRARASPGADLLLSPIGSAARLGPIHRSIPISPNFFSRVCSFGLGI